MPSIKLTNLAIEKLPASGERTDVYDAQVPGLVLRLTPKGTKSWSFMYRIKGHPRRLTLGAYPGVSLKLARERAREARAAIQRGEDPVEDKKVAERERQHNGFEACARDFIESYCKPKLRTWAQVESALERRAIPEFKDRPVKEIRRRDVVALLEKVAVEAPGLSHLLRAYLSKLFNWLLEREIVETNPVTGISAQHKPQVRERVLTDDEIRALCKATERMGGAFGACTRLLLLSGMRRDEAGKLRWDEVSEGWASLPASRMKAGRNYRAPLSKKAQEIIEGMPRFAGCPFVFTTGGKVAINGWGKTKKTLDEYASEELVDPWRLHDLRRTVASGLARLGTRAEVIKRILGHAPPASDVTASVYNQHSYDAEAREAMEAWAEYVDKVIEEGGSSVQRLAFRS
jgi:integrase